ncbi:MAG: hypothetical protein RR254_04430, partial [Muribaculaceae bacterium]
LYELQAQLLCFNELDSYVYVLADTNNKLSKIEKRKLLDSLSRITPEINQKEPSSTYTKNTKLVSLLQVNSSK